MPLDRPKISADRPTIRALDEAAINRIAAGEVVERPASAVKELVENAIDAGSSRIEVAYAHGGKSLIRVTDDGCGIAPGDLPLAVARHATSKIDGSDLVNIRSFGFRGEALASLGAVGRLSVTSRVAGDAAACLTMAGGGPAGVRPAALPGGTVIELRDLFFATPARLKFLRTDRAEAQAIADAIKRLAMAEPMVGFTLRDVTEDGPGRVVFRADGASGDLFDALRARLARVLGDDFATNALRIDAVRDGVTLTGFAALPTYSRGAAVAQYLFVNGRPVRDRLFHGALRAAYSDFLSRDRHPAAALFLDLPPAQVDQNVHPAKTEVRFRDAAAVRGLIVSTLRAALAGGGHRAATTHGDAALGAFRPEAARVYQMDRPVPRAPAGFAETAPVFARVEPEAADPPADPPADMPLGAARAQIHENYIVAQTAEGMVIVDQHAAHERLVYERLKAQMAANGVPAQALLIPQIVEIGPEGAARLMEIAADLSRLGLTIEPFGQGALAVQETPALLGPVDAEAMLRDILDELEDGAASDALRTRLDAILSRIACHGSVRSGRRMSADEMNALLRQMEATPHSGQCNHGRPTYVTLALKDIERLFGRT